MPVAHYSNNEKVGPERDNLTKIGVRGLSLLVNGIIIYKLYNYQNIEIAKGDIMGKSIIIGIAVFVLGFLLSVLLGNAFSNGIAENSYYYGIIFSVLYLSSILAISTTVLIEEIRKAKVN